MVARIKLLVEKNGITIANLEKICGIANGSIRRWDDKIPSIDKVFKVAQVLNTTLDYLFYGMDSHKCPVNMPNPAINYIQIENTSQKIDYSNRVLHLKDDTILTRFKEAREASGIPLQVAAKGAFLKEEDILMLEGASPSSDDPDELQKGLRNIDLEQYAYLAYKYNVDLFWLFCGKVRPPPAVVQDGQLAFPPYEFMMEGNERAATAMQKSASNYSHLKLREDECELLSAYSYLTEEGKGWVYDLILDYLRNRQKISYTQYMAGEQHRGGTA